MDLDYNEQIALLHVNIAKLCIGRDDNQAAKHLQAARAALKGTGSRHLNYYKALVVVELLHTDNKKLPKLVQQWEESIPKPIKPNT